MDVMKEAAIASLGLLLLFAASTKLVAGVRSFTRVVEAYKLLPQTLVGPVSALVLGTELVLGTLLVAGIALSVTLPATGLLFGVFAGATALAILGGRAGISCGCFGVDADTPLDWGVPTRAGFLAAFSFAMTRMPPETPKLAHSGGYVVGVSIAFCIVALPLVVVGLVRVRSLRSRANGTVLR
jgi:hypothetical protein